MAMQPEMNKSMKLFPASQDKARERAAFLELTRSVTMGKGSPTRVVAVSRATWPLLNCKLARKDHPEMGIDT